MQTTLPLLALLVLASSATGQIAKASASPRGGLKQDVGLARVELDYGRPGVKGREIFGGLEPFGRVWRTGANASTKISFSRAVKLAGEDVPAGTYALYTIPEPDAWTVILHKNTSLWGAGGYDPVQDLLRVTAPVQRLKETRETLQIDFEGFHANGADLFIAWADTKISVPVFVDSDEAVLLEIDEKVKRAEGEISAGSYFDAGMFYYEKNIELPQAAEWIDRAIERAPTAFWMIYFRAELAEVMGDDELARTLAEKALGMASASRGGDFGYISKSRLLLAKLERGSEAR